MMELVFVYCCSDDGSGVPCAFLEGVICSSQSVVMRLLFHALWLCVTKHYLGGEFSMFGATVNSVKHLEHFFSISVFSFLGLMA